MDFNTQVIEEFRANGGRVGGPFEGGRLLLLTTTGRGPVPAHDAARIPAGRSGARPRHRVGRGAPKNPAWFHNLVANPRVTVESGAFTYEADAVVLEGTSGMPRSRGPSRPIPGGASTRPSPGDAARHRSGAGRGRAARRPGSMGAMLVAVHDAFRSELALIRRRSRRRGRVGAQLRVNCLTLCQGLGNHHMGEDQQLFPLVGRHHPERGRGPPGRHTTPRLTRPALRREIGYAFARPALFGATVRDALAFGPTHPPDAQLIESARAARADTFIRRLPNGYDTPLSDAPMSGGELQRTGLARAFAHAYRILILDDATSSLDTVTEVEITDAVLTRYADRTRLIIAHRASTAARTDLVAWLENGTSAPWPPHDPLDQPRLPRHLHRPRKGRAPPADDGLRKNDDHPPITTPAKARARSRGNGRRSTALRGGDSTRTSNDPHSRNDGRAKSREGRGGHGFEGAG